MSYSLSARLSICLVLFIWLMACSTAVSQPIPVTPLKDIPVIEERPSVTTSPTATPTPAATVLALPSPTVPNPSSLATAVIPTNAPQPKATLPPANLPPATSTPTPPIYTYCAAPNDTFAKIAAAAGTSETELRAFNSLSPTSRLMLSQRLQLPPGSVPPHAWTTSFPADTLSYENQLATSIGGLYLGANNRQMRVALTFDIGFNPDNLLMMAYLAERNAPSTFFLVGANREMVQGILHYGHELANHSWTHADLTQLTSEQIREEIALPARIVPQQAEGASNRPFFRPPFGAINDTVRQIAAEEGFQLANWTVDSGDWQTEITTEQIVQNVINGLCPGAIVVMHGNYGINFAALPAILDYLDQAGYEPVTLSTLMSWE